MKLIRFFIMKNCIIVYLFISNNIKSIFYFHELFIWIIMILKIYVITSYLYK